MKQKRHTFNIQLNAIYDTDNPTKKEVEFILHDFNVSWNNSIIKKETAEKSLQTLLNMPIVAKYYSVSEPGADDDALGSHQAYLDQDRETGDPIIGLGTVPIGVFTEPAYIKTILDENGNEIEVVAGKGILWASRFPNVVGLLKEWVDSGVEVFSSMEILYDSYLFKDGIEEILSYTYEGHCILNSELRGNHDIVYPAYDVSKITKLVAQAINQNDVKERENVNFKKVFELSHSDIRSKLYQVLDVTLDNGTYSWIVDVYDEYFVVNLYNFDQNLDKYYKYNYSKTDETVEIDFESKSEVVEERKWVEVVEVKQLQSELESTKTQLSEAKEQIKEFEDVKLQKSEIEGKLSEATDKITQLNSQVEELKPFKAQLEKEEFEKQLSEKQELYKAKFEAVSAIEKFESEEVQDLIKKSLNDSDEGKNAINQLNSLLVDMVVIEKQNNENTVREVSSKRENLIPENKDFDSRYSE